MRTLALALTSGIAAIAAAPSALAQAPQPAAPPPLAEGAQINFAPAPPEGSVHDDRAADLNQAPPLRPRPQGLVVESALGALGFAGRFRHVAPPAYLFRTQVGFEVLRWLMIYAAGEVSLTDTGESQDASHSIAFGMVDFGGGLRVTIHATERVAVFVEGEGGAMTAIVPHNALTVLGFHNAESLNPAIAARLGVEWYQVDRHLALTAALGGRYATGFKDAIPSLSDIPLMWDLCGGLRYVF